MEQYLEHALAQIKANQISKLDLSSKNLTDEQCIILAEAIKHNQSLIKLNLNLNNIGAVGAQALSETLKINRTLTVLDLGNNKIGDVGVQALSEALVVNQTLTTLNVEFNQIGAKGIQELSEALKMNCALTVLNLEFNYMGGDIGIQALSEALKVNHSLTRLQLDFFKSQIGTACHEVIMNALKTNREKIKSIRNQTILKLLILFRHAYSSESHFPVEVWRLICNWLDFPSVSQGYRTSHAIASFLNQKNIFAEFNQRLQSKTRFRLLESHGPKLSESRFSFITPQPSFLSGVANTISQTSHEYAEHLQFMF